MSVTIRNCRVMCVVAACLTVAVSLSAQSENGAIESDPIRCWWKTDRAAIVVGERFVLTLTCGVIETAQAKVVPRMEQLDPTAISVSPFEVVEGTRHEDIVVFPWRYFQYEYTLRLIGDRFFGQDVDIPSVTISYVIESGPEAAQGRERGYVLPALPTRIATLVPRIANDIREAPVGTFAGIESRRFRATSELAAAGVFFGAAAILLGISGGKVLRSRRRSAPTRPTHRTVAVLAACGRTIRRLRSEVAGDGWTPERVSRAMAVCRVIAAVALGQQLPRTAGAVGRGPEAGEVVSYAGLFNRRRMLVSSAITPDALTDGIAAHTGWRRQTLSALQATLRVFTAAYYGQSGALDRASLDEALAATRAAVRRLQILNLRPERPAWFR